MARDYRAEYAARKARAAQRGATVFMQRQTAARNLGYRSYGQRAAARKTGVGLRPGDLARSISRTDKRQVIPTPAGTVVRSTPTGRGRAVIEGRIRNARPNARVTVVATIKLADGTKRDVTIFGRGGWSASQVAAGIAHFGSIGAFIAHHVALLYGDGFDASDVDENYDGFLDLSVTIT